MINKTIFMLSAILLALPSVSFAEYRYVDNGAIEDDATWTGTNGDSYNSSHAYFPGTGYGYTTLGAAIGAMSVGDKVYLREGTYTTCDSYTESCWDTPAELNGDSWDEGHYNYIGSFPTEWAILDGQHSSPKGVVFGHKYMTDGDIKYWVVERLGITGGCDPSASVTGGAGLWFAGGPVKIRYCDIYENWSGSGSDNPTGVTFYRLKDSVFEFNRLYHNGAEATNGEQVTSFPDYEDESAGYTDIADINEVTARNVYRYNYFNGSDGSTSCETNFKHKAHQILTDRFSPYWTYKDWGDKIHHNMFFGSFSRSVIVRQDFAQIYKNIFDSPSINIGQSQYGGWPGLYQCFYNNTLVDGGFRSSNETSCVGGCAPVCTDYCYDTDKPPFDFTDKMYSNIFAFFNSTAGNDYQFIIGAESPETLNNVRNEIDISNTYIYPHQDDDNAFSIGSAMSELDNHYGRFTVGSFDSIYGFTNYNKISSEGTDNIFQGASGADQYITRPDHVVETGITIANGGKGGGHPYLDGVILPTYLGATNPDDHDWVAGVMSLNSSYFTSVAPGSTPPWIEGELADCSDHDGDQTACEGAGCVFCSADDSCNSTECCGDSAPHCEDQTSCEDAGWNWCTDVCQEDECSGQPPECVNCVYLDGPGRVDLN